ncbi:hypothetical protein PsorP6_000219 [Peronosclerospora sorghi]|uniref:Uncharacterized protein n=1 Tax=Peronosclerospora sorghi TaxID=230839 RepID=A0ACC0WR04_9STRA|nr:hypothetical protein PsorP6_000219 [Peronosclerospora sorghi]
MSPTTELYKGQNNGKEANAVTLYLKETEYINVVASDVYNAKEQALRTALCGRSTTEALVDKIRNESLEYRTKLDDNGAIQILFITKQDTEGLVSRGLVASC